MNLELAQLPDTVAEDAASILAQAGVTDVQVARHLEAVGAVLRRHKIAVDGAPRVSRTTVDGIASAVTYIFAVKCSPEEAFKLNVELAMEEEEMGIEKNQAFDALFLPA